MNRFTYVDILQSQAGPDHFYIGRTQNQHARIVPDASGRVLIFRDLGTAQTPREMASPHQPRSRARAMLHGKQDGPPEDERQSGGPTVSLTDRKKEQPTRY